MMKIYFQALIIETIRAGGEDALFESVGQRVCWQSARCVTCSCVHCSGLIRKTYMKTKIILADQCTVFTF